MPRFTIPSLAFALAFAPGLGGLAGAAGPAAPAGWSLAGSAPRDYSLTLDTQGAHGGRSCALLQAVAPQPQGFGTMMQMVSAAEHRGQRIRLSAFVSSRDVSQWAGLWMRVDGASGQVLAFDNMVDRPIRGTTEWRRYAVVLDVPADAQAIGFGVLLTGGGTVRADDFAFETVGPEVPTTGTPPLGPPRNLDLEK